MPASPVATVNLYNLDDNVAPVFRQATSNPSAEQAALRVRAALQHIAHLSNGVFVETEIHPAFGSRMFVRFPDDVIIAAHPGSLRRAVYVFSRAYEPTLLGAVATAQYLTWSQEIELTIGQPTPALVGEIASNLVRFSDVNERGSGSGDSDRRVLALLRHAIRRTVTHIVGEQSASADFGLRTDGSIVQGARRTANLPLPESVGDRVSVALNLNSTLTDLTLDVTFGAFDIDHYRDDIAALISVLRRVEDTPLAEEVAEPAA